MYIYIKVYIYVYIHIYIYIYNISHHALALQSAIWWKGASCSMWLRATHRRDNRCM